MDTNLKSFALFLMGMLVTLLIRILLLPAGALQIQSYSGSKSLLEERGQFFKDPIVADTYWYYSDNNDISEIEFRALTKIRRLGTHIKVIENIDFKPVPQ